MDHRAAERRRRQLWNRFFLFAAVAAVLVTLPQFLIGPGGEELEVTPDEVMGTWVTDDARYVDRAITIGAEQVALGLGDGSEEVHTVLAIRGERDPVFPAYEITYAGTSREEVLEVCAYDDRTLRLRNPSEVPWAREED